MDLNFVERETKELIELSRKWKEAGITSMEQISIIFTVGPPPDCTKRVRILNET